MPIIATDAICNVPIPIAFKNSFSAVCCTGTVNAISTTGITQVAINASKKDLGNFIMYNDGWPTTVFYIAIGD